MFERLLSPWRKDADLLQLLAAEDEAAPAPKMDGWLNRITGMGGKNDLACRNQWGLRSGLDLATLESIYEFSAIGARMVDQEPDDSTREGFELVGIDREDQERLNTRLGKMEYLPKLADAQRWANLYGGGAIYMQVQDGQTSDKPVDMANIVTVSGLTALDRWDLTVLHYDTDPSSANFGNPLMYQLSIEGTTKFLHYSRVLPFYGAKLSWRAQRRRNGWGVPVFDRSWDAFEAYGTAHQLLKNALLKINQGVLLQKGLNRKLAGGQKTELKKRLQTLLRQISMLGDMVLDKDHEDYKAVQRGVAGFKETLEAFENHLVANSPMPKSILLGQTPGGLNSGENAGDWESWGGYISAQQRKKLTPQTRRYLDIEFASLTSPLSETPETYEIEWASILQVSPKDKADIHLKNSQARTNDITSGVVTEDQAKRQDDVVEAYKLTEEEVAEETQPSLIRPSESDLQAAAENIRGAPPDRQQLMLASIAPDSTREQRENVIRLVNGDT